MFTPLSFACSKVADVMQIPAFLCRQTDLLVAAAKTGCIINIKKGQFCAASVMRNSAEKVRASGNPNVMVCERGTMFGYSDLIVDPRNLVWMRDAGCPVVRTVDQFPLKSQVDNPMLHNNTTALSPLRSQQHPGMNKPKEGIL